MLVHACAARRMSKPMLLLLRGGVHMGHLCAGATCAVVTCFAKERFCPWGAFFKPELAAMGVSIVADERTELIAAMKCHGHLWGMYDPFVTCKMWLRGSA